MFSRPRCRKRRADEQTTTQGICSGDACKQSRRLSPGASQASWLAPFEGFMNIWIAPTQDIPEARSDVDGGAADPRPALERDGRFLTDPHDVNSDESRHVFAAGGRAGQNTYRRNGGCACGGLRVGNKRFR
jgi:hypothetical protein